MPETKFVIDGDRFSTLQEFYEEFRNVVTPGYWWGANLDAFNDVLRGGFGTPDEGYVLVWKNSDISRVRLGYSETVNELERRLSTAHPSARSSLLQRIQSAKEEKGDTVFDWLINAIKIENPLIHLQLE